MNQFHLVGYYAKTNERVITNELNYIGGLLAKTNERVTTNELIFIWWAIGQDQ